MAYVYFRVGDYEYSNMHPAGTHKVDDGSTNVAVRVAKDIRETVETLDSIPSTVTYNGTTYTVKYPYGIFPDKPYGTIPSSQWGGSLTGIFYRCNALKQTPTLPSNMVYDIVDYLFRSCYALESVPTLPSGVISMKETYTACEKIEAVPPIPSTATDLQYCFWNCSKLKTAPTLPPAVTRLDYAFARCTELETAPEIPATATNVEHAFYYCENLSGNIVVNNTPTIYTNIFKQTVNDIYIINGGNAGSVWKDTIAPSYSNVHYEADDHPAPTVSSLTATRVASDGSTAPAEKGLWVYLNATADISTELLPVGWASEFGSVSVQMDGTTITPTWTASASTGTITLTAWVNINDLSAHAFTVSITEDIKEGATTKKTLTSASISASVPKAYALVDYYHDPTTGTEGFAVGKYAEHADLFDVAMPSLFEDTLTAQDMTAQEVSDFVDNLDTRSRTDIGTIYTANWTATTSSGNATQVTNSITIPAGTYIFSVKIPVVSQSAVAYSVQPFGVAVGGYFGMGQAVQTYIYTVDQPTTCYVVTGMSTTTNYTYIERGYLRAVRIA